MSKNISLILFLVIILLALYIAYKTKILKNFEEEYRNSGLTELQLKEEFMKTISYIQYASIGIVILSIILCVSHCKF